MDVGLLQGLCPSQQCAPRQNEQNLLELVPRVLNRTPLRLLLAWHDLGNTHGHELVEVLHHVCQLCVYGISVTVQLATRFLQSGTLLLPVPHLISSLGFT